MKNIEDVRTLAMVLALSLEAETGASGVFQRLVSQYDGQYRERVIVKRTMLEAMQKALSSLPNVCTDEFVLLTRRLLRIKDDLVALTKFFIELAWIRSGRRWYKGGRKAQRVIRDVDLGDIFRIFLEGLCRPEPRVFVVQADGIEKPASPIQLLSDRLMARWGIRMSQPEYVLLLAACLGQIPEPERLGFLNRVMNEVLNNLPEDLQEFQAMLHHLRPTKGRWDEN